VSIVADSFAGERERHTLETLLASRLPDKAILFGKIGTSVLYSWSITLAGMAVALVTVNLAFGGNGLLMYSPDTLLVGVIMNALVALMTATVGVLISLWASTVRQAQQTISLLFVGPSFGLIFGIQAIPADVKSEIMASLGNLNMGTIISIAIGLILLIDVGLILLAQNRFKRSKLALD
jgi:ABC-2 type transport system permease protein